MGFEKTPSLFSFKDCKLGFAGQADWGPLENFPEMIMR